MILGLAMMVSACAGTDPQFHRTIKSVENMVSDPYSQDIVSRYGLSLVNVTWEDTGRDKNSALGPNISDLTIGVRDHSGALHPMPVIRFDNYNDRTADLDSDEFYVRIGNEDHRALRPVTLKDILKNTKDYLHNPASWTGGFESLWAHRDENVLVSAQACFLPIPASGKATFTPVIYNYQSSPGAPAVATIVATREGTSIQVVENRSGYLSDVLYFNENGQRAPFTAVRKSDFIASGGDSTSGRHGIDAADDPGLNVVLIIQVPLKLPYQNYRFSADELSEGNYPAASVPKEYKKSEQAEDAVIGHGETEGPFFEFNGLPVERDPQFPVRVTVQFYKATTSGQIHEADVAEIRQQIDRVYDQGSYVGSLVTSGLTHRPTEWQSVREPKEDANWSAGWWTKLKSW